MRTRSSIPVLAMLVGCAPAIPTLEGVESESDSDASPLTTTSASDGLEGTGVDPSATDGGSTTVSADDTTTGDDPGVTSAVDSTTTGDPSTSDGDSSGSVGSSESSDSTDTSDTAAMACEDMLEKISCDALADGPSILNAIGLGCEGDPLETIPVGAFTFPPATDPESFGIATQFGTYVDAVGDPAWGPREGESFLVLSTGAGIVPDEEGLLTFSPAGAEDANDNPDDSPLPAPIDWTFKGPFKAAPVSANDLVWFQVDIEAPPGVTGFAIDMAFFSEEFPENTGTTFNDALAIWVDNGEASYEACADSDGDITCTVTALWPVQYQGDDPELEGTGFVNDGGTGWSTVRGPVIAGETFQLTVAVFDQGDWIFNTTVLLDAFRWECDGCDGTPGNECGLGS